MRTMILAAALAAATGGAAFAQTGPYVTYGPYGQWNSAPGPYDRDRYRGDRYYDGRYGAGIYHGGASARIPGPYYGDTSGYADNYNQHGPGVFVFDGENVNQDQNYSGR